MTDKDFERHAFEILRRELGPNGLARFLQLTAPDMEITPDHDIRPTHQRLRTSWPSYRSVAILHPELRKRWNQFDAWRRIRRLAGAASTSADAKKYGILGAHLTVSRL